MSAELKASFEGISVKLIAGGGGIFEVEVDGNLIFDKAETGRFPQDGEVTNQLQG